jgi:hypothetical protein
MGIKLAFRSKKKKTLANFPHPNGKGHQYGFFQMIDHVRPMLSLVAFVPLSPTEDELFAKRSGHAPRTNEYMDAMHSMASIITIVGDVMTRQPVHRRAVLTSVSRNIFQQSLQRQLVYSVTKLSLWLSPGGVLYSENVT